MVDRVVASARHAGGLPEIPLDEVVIRRTSTGWRVEGSATALPADIVDDLGHALTLADLLADGTVPGPRPPRPADGADETTRLRSSVRQLEHALVSRVIVEQAIGVLSERWKVSPRDAFEQLRRVTRSLGLRIHDLAKLVIESSTNPEIVLPPELVPVRRGAPPEPRQSPDGRERPETVGTGERRGRTRRERPGPAADSTSRPAPARVPAARTPLDRHAHAEGEPVR